MKVFKLDSNAVLPTRNHPTDGGADLYSLEDVFLPVGSTMKIATGVAIEVPKGMVGRIAGRSSMNKKGIIASPGVIDTGYSGDVSVMLHNFSCRQDTLTHPGYMEDITQYGYHIKAGDKIAQVLLEPVIIEPIEETTELWKSERADKGWGSSGR